MAKSSSKKTPYEELVGGLSDKPEEKVIAGSEPIKAKAVVTTIVARAVPKTASFTSAPSDSAYLVTKSNGKMTKMSKAQAVKTANKYPESFEVR